jgi:hypothetical protein
MKLSLKIVIASVLSLSALGATGCHTGSRLDAPDGFAVLDGRGHRGNDTSYDWRAASAQGVVLAVRTEKNDPRANVDFWADAVDVRMRRDGYAAEAKRDVTSATGLSGKQLRYTREEDRRVYRYWLTVFVAGDSVYVIEAGGDKESFDPAEKNVERAVLSVHPS